MEGFIRNFVEKRYGWHIMDEFQYNYLVKRNMRCNELEDIVNDNDIEIKRKKLEVKYKKYLSRYYQDEKGHIFRIKRVGYGTHIYIIKQLFVLK